MLGCLSMYHVLKDPRNECKLPKEALAVVRYHSFYPWHREGAYGYLMGEGDEEMLGWVREFNSFDLYNKTEERVDVGTLKRYYMDLVEEFFPRKEIFW